MAISWIQKMRLGIRGWTRRQEEKRAIRDRELLKKNASWSTKQVQAPAGGSVAAKATATPASHIDLEGLQIAFLDDSGQIEHYLDPQSGEVVEFRIADQGAQAVSRDSRLIRVPRRSSDSDRSDCSAFCDEAAALDLRSKLLAALQSEDPLGAFRSVLATSRPAERAWYNFKNERAYEVVERWVAGLPALRS